MDTCPVCKSGAQVVILVENNRPVRHEIICVRCGHYSVTSSGEATLRAVPFNDRQAAIVSGYLRSNQRVEISEYDIERLRTLPLPRPQDRARPLLRWLADTQPDLGALIDVNCLDPETQARGWAVGPTDIRFLVVHYLAKERGFFEVQSDPGQHVRGVITPKGWRYLDGLKKSRHESSLAFVAMNLNDETRRLREEGLKPAIVAAGYDPRIMDEVDHNKHIDDEILASIRRSRFLIADLTNQRQNVYYEAGFAQALGLEVIWTVRKDHLEKNVIHLDTRQFPFIDWTEETLPTFTKRLKDRIIRTVGEGPIRDTGANR